jgi:hypothetical protein
MCCHWWCCTDGNIASIKPDAIIIATANPNSDNSSADGNPTSANNRGGECL